MRLCFRLGDCEFIIYNTVFGKMDRKEMICNRGQSLQEQTIGGNCSALKQYRGIDMNTEKLRNFYKGKKVLITGNTGFKGTWMTQVLLDWGARVVGYSFGPPTEPSLFAMAGLTEQMTDYRGDIRDKDALLAVFEKENPEIAIHMAAQPIVRESYNNPAGTYETNVMGTVHFLDGVRMGPSVKSVVNVTTDKVYMNQEWQWGYRENEPLNGYDPYSNSKSCSELVTSCFIQSFFSGRDIGVSTCRAGNVIGGGDFASDRVIPDCIRAVEAGVEMTVRNPDSTRPYQHVLEPIAAYLLIAMEQYENPGLAGNYNVGPQEADCWRTGDLVSLFCAVWNRQIAGTKLHRASWRKQNDGGPHEANFLKLDCSKLKTTFGWKPRWNVETAMDKIVEWSRVYLEKGDVKAQMAEQVREFFCLDGNCSRKPDFLPGKE